jgi:hypothetical protein
VQGGEGGPLSCNGATVIGAMGWLGLARLARHGLGERETEQRERTRATISRNRHWGGSGWLVTVRKCREQREERREVKWVEALACFGFGKWFTEIFSVNRFPFFPSRFYGKKQRFSV